MPIQDKNTVKKLSEEEQLRRDNHVGNRTTGMTIASRIVLFFMFPLLVGSAGLAASHLQNMFGKEPVPLNFDRDFVYPFLITMVLVVVVSVQTGNFSTYKASPLIAWPKVVKKQKITRKTIVVDDDGNVIEDADELIKNLKTGAIKKDD